MRQCVRFVLAAAVLFGACSHDGRVLDDPTAPLPTPTTTLPTTTLPTTTLPTTTLPTTTLVELTISPFVTAG